MRVDQFNWTEAALVHLDGVTRTDVADVIYAKPAEQLVRVLAPDGRIVMGRADSGVWVIVLLIPNRTIIGVWDIAFARIMTSSEIEAWQRWRAR